MTHTITLADLCNLIAQGNHPVRITFRERTYEYRNGRYENDVYGVLVLAFSKEYLDEFITYTDTILTNKEREYLSAVLKPWKGEDMEIIKYPSSSSSEYISVRFKNCDRVAMVFPDFKTSEYYKGMKLGTMYPPEELELWTE